MNNLRPNERVFDLDNLKDLSDLQNPFVDGEKKGTGHDPDQVVKEMFNPPSELKLIPRSEWSDRLKDQLREGSRLSDIRRRAKFGTMMECLDQGPVGYCWGHSVAHDLMLARAVAGMPYVALSAYSICAPIKNGRDEGGWCGLAAQFARKYGCAPQEKWKQGDRNYRQLFTDEMKAVMANYKVTEEWMDLAKADYDHSLTFDQLATCLLSGIPCAVDFNWWGHSVCALDLVEVSAGAWGIRILNSWGMGWGEQGEQVLTGSKAVPNGALGIRVVGLAA